MQIRCYYRWVVPAVLSAVLVGCGHSRSDRAVTGYGPCDPCDATRALPRGRLSPLPVSPPPGAPLPVGPASGSPLPVNPPAAGVPPGTTFPPGPITQSPPAWRPAAPDARLYPPSGAADDRGSGARLLPPESAEPAPATPPPATREEPPLLPVDVPGYAIAKKQVASGQKPFADGVNWLRAKGYTTVLHLRPPGADDAADRRLFEAKGFRYITLEVAPDRINRELLDQFTRTVSDESNLPLFVYDRDSSLAGGLWYLYFRTAGRLPDDRAAEEAGRLGLNTESGGGAHREMWLAVQNYLQMSK